MLDLSGSLQKKQSYACGGINQRTNNAGELTKDMPQRGGDYTVSGTLRQHARLRSWQISSM
jgi:hypothetical protein